MKIGFGAARLSSLKTISAARAVPHSKFNYPHVDWDIGIVKAAKRFPMSATVRPIPLVGSGQGPSDNERVMVSGWGTLKYGGSVSQQLMAVNIVIINRSVCSKFYQGVQPVTKRMICAGVPAGGKDPCHGDSGGALVSLNSKKQIGIVSWSQGCAEPKKPAVFTNVADQAMQTFIQNQIRY